MAGSLRIDKLTPAIGQARRRLHWLAGLALAPTGFYSKPMAAQPEATAAPVMRMVTTEFAPYMSEKMPEQGAAVAITRAALASQGWQLKLEFRPWARVLIEVEAGQHDGLLGAWYQADRERYLVYTRPMGVENPVGFYALRRGRSSFTAPADLAGLRIGTVQGYANPKAFERAVVHQGAQVQPARDDLTNLRKLLAGRVDLILIDRGVARYLIQTQLPGAAAEFVWLDPAVERMPLHLAVARVSGQQRMLHEVLEQGLQTIARNGLMERTLLRWKDWL